MTHLYEVSSDLLDQAHQGFADLFYHLESLDLQYVRDRKYPGLSYMSRDIGYLVMPEYIESYNDDRINNLYSELYFLRPMIRYHNYPNTPGKRDGISPHVDKSSQNDPCNGIHSTALNFAIEGCDANTRSRWYRVIDAKWPDQFIYDTKDSYLGVALNSLEGVEVAEERYMETGKTYLFRTNVFHDARAKEHTGNRRVLCCMHFTNACNWDDYTEQFRRRGWVCE
tara:strand:+ start:1237 stop:1911 length:675 start_codon:yes stop_codon:yes gene_type:complete